MKFTHLILSSDYSLIHGTLRLKEIFKRKKLLRNIDCFVLTDVNNCFGAIDLSLGAKRNNLKAIYGCSILLRGSQYEHFIYLLAKNPQGYHSLMSLTSYGFQNLKRINNVPVYNWSDLVGLNNVICISGGMYGEIGHTLITEPYLAEPLIRKYIDLFGNNNLALDVHRIYPDQFEEELYNKRACYYGEKMNIPVVATNYVLFEKEEDYLIHQVKYCIETKHTLYGHAYHPFSKEQYFKTADQMIQLFQDIPAVIENIKFVTDQCNMVLPTDKLPIFPKCNINEKRNILKELKDKAIEGLWKKCPRLSNPDKKIYLYRLFYEIKIVISKGYSHYFIMIQDIVNWALHEGIPVGPGRGSGGSSLLAYCLNIIDIDPIVHCLLFERFLNAERSSFLDFDIDFCIHGRNRVIHYIKERYGNHRISQIISYSALGGRSAIRDVCRVFHEHNKAEEIVKYIPSKLGTTLASAIEETEELKDYRDHKGWAVNRLIHYSLQLEGVIRSAGKHAAGVLVAHDNIYHMGIYCKEGEFDNSVIQWDKDGIEVIGLLKVDILGLRTLSSMQHTLKLLQERDIHLPHLKKNQLEYLNDDKTLTLISQGRSDGVFQLESRKMQRLLASSKLNKFQDIVAIISLFRPGPINSGMTSTFVKIRNGQEEVWHLHPDLTQDLEETYGLIVYQEQVMKAAQILGGLTIGQGDTLQRAISKKKLSAITIFEKVFIKNGLKKGIDKNLLHSIFAIIKNFAGYGFNKSHAVAYALIAYRTAYLKANHPIFFYLGLLAQNTNYYSKYILSAMNDGIMIKQPCVNISLKEFTYFNDKTIFYGLSFIKGLSSDVIDRIIQEREEHGLFHDINDFMTRCFTGHRKISACEILIHTGAMDVFINDIYPSRESMLDSLNYLFKKINRGNSKKLQDQHGEKWLSFIPLTEAEKVKKEVYYLSVNLDKSHVVKHKYFLRFFNLTKSIQDRLPWGTRGVYMAIVLDSFYGRNSNIVTVQIGSKEVVLFDVKRHDVEVGDIVIIKSETGSYLDRETGSLSIGKISSIKKIQDELASILKTVVIHLNSKEELEVLSSILRHMAAKNIDLKKRNKPKTSSEALNNEFTSQEYLDDSQQIELDVKNENTMHRRDSKKFNTCLTRTFLTEIKLICYDAENNKITHLFFDSVYAYDIVHLLRTQTNIATDFILCEAK